MAASRNSKTTKAKGKTGATRSTTRGNTGQQTQAAGRGSTQKKRYSWTGIKNADLTPAQRGAKKRFMNRQQNQQT